MAATSCWAKRLRARPEHTLLADAPACPLPCAMADATVYEAAGGAVGVLRLAHAWHDRVMADDLVSHAFEGGFHPQHTERLAAYWGEAWGGPAAYTERYGTESDVVRIHSGNGPHEAMDRRSIACFERALDDVGIVEPRLRSVLLAYFTWATTTTMAAYPHDASAVPEGLRLPRWSWDGLVEEA